MSSNDIDKFYVSPYDKFLFEFDEKHAKTASQIKEIEKNGRIAHMRDDKEYNEPNDGIWEAF